MLTILYFDVFNRGAGGSYIPWRAPISCVNSQNSSDEHIFPSQLRAYLLVRKTQKVQELLTSMDFMSIVHNHRLRNV